MYYKPWLVWIPQSVDKGGSNLLTFDWFGLWPIRCLLLKVSQKCLISVVLLGRTPLMSVALVISHLLILDFRYRITFALPEWFVFFFYSCTQSKSPRPRAVFGQMADFFVVLAARSRRLHGLRPCGSGFRGPIQATVVQYRVWLLHEPQTYGESHYTGFVKPVSQFGCIHSQRVPIKTQNPRPLVL